MKLKFRIAKLEDVAEQYRGLYVKTEQGDYVIDVEGAADAGKLKEFRDNNVELMKKLDQLKDVDPKKYQELLNLDTQVREKKLIEAGKIDEVIAERVKAMQTEHEKKVKELSDQLNVSTRQLETLLIDNAVKTAAAQNGVLPTALDDVVLRAKTTFAIVEGKPVAKDKDGKIVYGADGVNPMSVEGWTKALKETAPHLFAGFSGSGANGGKGGAGGNNQNLSSRDKIAQGLMSMGGPAAP